MMNTAIKRTALAFALLLPLAAQAGEAGVDFAQPEDGATVGREVHVAMRVHGMKVHPAGEVIPGTGHHHLIVDGAFVPKGEIVPKDATHMHFGKGQTETTVRLTPGAHTLTLQFADGHHHSYGKAMSKTINVYVK